MPAPEWLHLLPVGILGIVSWGIWLVRRILSHRARPIGGNCDASTSVIIPVYREDPPMLSACLDTWLATQPDEIVLVVDEADIECLAMLAARDLPPSCRVIPFQHRGKRSALGVGIRAARNDIVVLADSDTAWQPGLLREIVRPFADPRVGGVGSRQFVAAPESSIWRRVAAWLLDIRFLDYVPAMGSRGSVPCLSGRTAAYRRHVVLPLLPQLESEIFLGRECIAGDDGRLTWLVLSQGYRTVHQRTAEAVSMFPDTLRAFLKQRMRWSRNSYRCYLTAVWKGWLWRQPAITQLTVLQILLTPLTMGIALFLLAAVVATQPVATIAICVTWLFLGRLLRGLSHLRRVPRDIVLLPVIVVMTIVIALPIKITALITMNRQGWLTRKADRLGGEGQNMASLSGHVGMEVA